MSDTFGEVSNKQDLATVHALVAALARTVKASKIYMSNNEVLRTFKTELKEYLREFLESEGELELEFRPGIVMFHGDVVFRDVGGGTGFAGKLFDDGMRKLVIRRGITEFELDDLIDVMVTDYEEEVNLEDDLVTKVWEKDFTNIDIAIAEEVLRSTDVWDPNAVPAEKVVGYLEYGGPGMPGEDSGENVQEFAFIKPVAPSSYQHTVTMEELNELEAEIQRARMSNPLLDFNELVFEILDSDRTAQEARILLDTAARNLNHMSKQGLFDAATETVERLRSVRLLLSIPGMDVDKEVGEILDKASIESAGNALDYAEQAQDVRTEELTSFLKTLEGCVLELLLERLETTNRPHVRTALVDALTHHCRYRPNLLKTALLRSTKPSMIRDLISIVAAIGDLEHLKYLPKFLRHQDIAVRAETVRAIGRFKSPDVVPLLLTALKDPAERIRLTATRQLAYSGDFRALEGIQARIDSPAFDKLSMTEQRYLFTAVALLGKESVVPYLAGFLQETSGFGGHGSPRGLNAVYALASIGTPSAVQVLERAAGTGPKKVKEACHKALAKLTVKGEGS